jgi:formamidopyrimidine-DNA glycosylase
LEVCRRNLERWSTGRALADVALHDPASLRHKLSTRPADADPDGEAWLRARIGQRFGTPVRRGKRVLWPLGDGGLLVHLGMTGKWKRGGPVTKAIRASLTLDDGAVLHFSDPRRFGCLVPGADDAMLGAGLGPDALSGLDGPALAARMGSRGQLKVLLMDQARLAGVGNIQAAETLYRAKVGPWASPASLDEAAWDRVATELESQLQYTIAVTDADDVAYMSDGAHVDNPFAVYGREGESCRLCGTTIVKSRQGGRATFWCPGCQGITSGRSPTE